MRGLASFGVVLVGACSSYHAGSYSGPRGPFAGDRATVGCLDVAVAAHPDAAASGPVLAYEFGNRCDHATTVDLTAVAVRARTVDGRAVLLAPYDPLAELRAARLEARRTGREVIEYRASAPIAIACAELAGLEGGYGEARTVCVAMPDAAPAAAAQPAVAEVSP